jgi:hypothetical protein
VDSHYGGALGVDMAPFRELPNTAAFFGLCECGNGGPGFVLHQTEIETHYEFDNRSNLARRFTVKL